MKICFVCGFLEPGKSGVGDYAILLARKMQELGHECSLLSIHDPLVNSPLEWNLPDTRIPVCRLPQELPWEARVEKAREFLEEKSPQILSLQYVTYAYAKRGLVFELGARLREISGEIPWHVMVHEIWLGERQGAKLKERIVGAAQKWLTKDVFMQIAPSKVHTSNATYQGCLSKIGVESSILPMFCTVPVSAEKSSDEFYKKVSPKFPELSRETREQYILFGMFGVLFPEWPPEPLFEKLNAYCKKLGKKGVIISIGGMGPGKELWNRLKERYKEQFRFVEIGRVGEAEISPLLLQMDFGLAATPRQLLGKSTSAAAFLEHGIPLIVNRGEPYGLPSDEDLIDPLVIPLDDHFKERIDVAKKRPPHARVDEVIDQFVKDLKSVKLQT